MVVAEAAIFLRRRLLPFPGTLQEAALACFSAGLAVHRRSEWRWALIQAAEAEVAE
jgi:hypothetical protein